MDFIKKKITIQKLPSGDALKIWVYTFWGSGKKNVYIQANIHGPEITGILVIKKLIKYLVKNKLDFKKLVVVPSCNPMGLNSQFIGQQTGYVNQLTGKNWNRIYHDISTGIDIKRPVAIQKFKGILLKNLKEKILKEKSLESKLALVLQSLSFNSDVVIDLHTAWGKAPHYVYCYKEHINEAKKFGVGNIIILAEEDFFGVFDEAQLYPYFRFKEKIINFVLPKEVYTLELGSDNQLEKENIDLSFSELLGFFKNKKVLKSETDFCLNKDFVYYYAPAGGLIVWNVEPGDYFKKAQKIAEIYCMDSETTVPVVSNHDGKMLIRFNAHAVHEGQEICKSMTRINKGDTKK